MFTTYFFIIGIGCFIVGLVLAFSIRNAELTRLRKLRIVRNHSEFTGPNEVVIYSHCIEVNKEYRLWSSDELYKIPDGLDGDTIYIVITLFGSSVPPKSIVIKRTY